ncbi:GntR family transcriptional regulator [Clostridium beijerinckii]|uniref:GntR family transcriptional regulator n=1 Tax=Clostridium beijerinckii TaxID=1520 RepID=A0A7X9XPZ0_CLOBE|nr:GntR family transcriptional regulator [Clostridium beijerinckii]NMF06032.1 GntR family transcriptional regulator [Clostridium beijerinckii]
MKYIDVYKDIKEKIQKGIYKSWTSLEGEELLCIRYGISRTTIRKALGKLKQDGYLHSRQGSGIFINPPEFYEEKNLTTLSEKIEGDIRLENLILDFKTIEANKELAEIFNIHIGDKLFYYKRLRTINNSPRVIEETYMPQYLFKEFDKEKAMGAVLRYIEKDCNYTISHDVKNITAINLDKGLAELLQMEEGVATLQIIHKVYLIRSILAQYTKETQTQNNTRFVSVR